MRSDISPAMTWLLIGDTTSAHFEHVNGLLRGGFQHQAASLADALDWLESDQKSPDGVLVYQSFPDEFAPDLVERVVGLLPLARWIVCFGPWCESMGRTEQVWPVAWCVPLKDVKPRIARTFEAHVCGEPVLLPTMSRDESFARSATQLAYPLSSESSRAAVRGDDPPFIETTSAILQNLGYTLVDTADADLIVLVVRFLNPDLLDEIAMLRRTPSLATLVVVSDLLTAADVCRVRSSGADEVISTLRFADALASLPKV